MMLKWIDGVIKIFKSHSNIFSNIKIMTHRGIDAAPWNVILNSSSISKTDNKVLLIKMN